MSTQLLTALPTQLIAKKLPKHVAIIMDGNGRWASQRNRPRTEGHRQGAKNLKKMLRCCQDWGIQALTVYAFSTENWQRPWEEVSFLFGLFENLLRKELSELCESGVRVKFIGDLSLLPRSLQAEMHRSMMATANNPGVQLNVAINYGSRQEIIRACRHIAEKVKWGELQLENIDEQLFGAYLDMDEIGDPDLMIRTSGEMRLSNFLLWQMAYTEMYFSKALWPDFDETEFKLALAEFQNRDRRYGQLSASE